MNHVSDALLALYVILMVKYVLFRFFFGRHGIFKSNDLADEFKQYTEAAPDDVPCEPLPEAFTKYVVDLASHTHDFTRDVVVKWEVDGAYHEFFLNLPERYKQGDTIVLTRQLHDDAENIEVFADFPLRITNYNPVAILMS